MLFLWIFSVCKCRRTIYKPSRLFYINSLDRFISYIGVIWLVFYHYRVLTEFLSNANSINSDKMLSAASDLGLH